MNRRTFLSASLTSTAVSTPLLGNDRNFKATGNTKSGTKLAWQNGKSDWPICLDTATLDKGIGIEQKLRLAAEAGFDCVEPWDRELDQYEKEGGNLKDLKSLVEDLGLYIPSVIGLILAIIDIKINIDQHIIY